MSKQPKALEIAKNISIGVEAGHFMSGGTFEQAAALLRSQHEVIAELANNLTNLHALVWGECPSLLNEDSGGNSALDMDISAALLKAQEAQQ